MAPVASKVSGPSAPSLLWAHEIRRENANLVKELDKANATAAAAISATSTAEKLLFDLQRAVLELNSENERLSARLDNVETGQIGVLNTMKRVIIFNKTMEVEETVNGDVQQSVKKVARGEITNYIEVDDETSKSGASQKGNIQGSGSVPDPKNARKTRSQSGRQRTPQELSSTASPSACSQESTEIVESCPGKKRQYEDLAEDSMIPMKQGGRTFSEYLQAVENIRATLPPSEQDGKILEEFVRGLDDPKATALFEAHLNYFGKTWDVIKSCLGMIIGEQKAQAVSTEKEMSQNEKNSRKRVRKTSPSMIIGEQKSQAVRAEQQISQNGKNSNKSAQKASLGRVIGEQKAQEVSAAKQVNQNETNNGKSVRKASPARVISKQETRAATPEKQVLQNEKNKGKSVRKASPARVISKQETRAVSPEKQVLQNEKKKGKRTRKASVSPAPQAKKRRFIPIVPPDEEDMVICI